MSFLELLWPGGGPNRMWFASQGFVQNERGEWVRPDEVRPLTPPNTATPTEAETQSQPGNGAA